MSEFRPFLYRGMERVAKVLLFADREGISYSHNPGGAPYVTTTVGQEFYAPGDYLVATTDMAVVRVYKREDFEPFAKEVIVAEPVTEKTGGDDDRADGGGDVHGEGKPRDGGGSVRVAHAEAAPVGKAGNGRARRAAQRRVGNHGRDAGKPRNKPKGSRKTHLGY